VTADVGATDLVLHEEADWIAGEEIIITTTDYEWRHSEVRVIASTSTAGGKTTLTLTKALERKHFAGDI
jgi:hypothetical protein